MTRGRRAENPRMSGDRPIGGGGGAGAAAGLAEGERDGTAYEYTQPSPGRYPWQWYWDSCFAAIVWRRFDPAKARAELESLLAAQRPDGFIGHTIFWNRPVSLVRLAFYNVASRSSFQTETIQPPLLAWAWRIAVGDPAEEPRIGAQMDWLAGQPRPRGRRPALDPPARRVRPRRLAEVRTGLGPLLERAHRLPAAGPPQPQAGLRRAPVARTWPPGPLRDPGQHDVVALAAGAGPALGDSGLGRAALGRAPRPLHRRGAAGRGRPDVVTWASLAPLALPDLPEEIGRRLIEEHLLNEREFLTPVAPPSVAVSEPGYEPDGGHGPIRRYWRGPTWINSAWMVWLGMRRLGYEEEAQRLADGLIATVAREGLREYYDPRTGKGMGAKDFAWSALIAELADPDEGAKTSYL